MTLQNFAFNSDKSELDSSRVRLHWIQLTTSKTAERKLHVIIWCLLQLNFLTLRSVIFVQRNQIFASKVFILTEFVASRTLSVCSSWDRMLCAHCCFVQDTEKPADHYRTMYMLVLVKIPL